MFRSDSWLSFYCCLIDFIDRVFTVENQFNIIEKIISSRQAVEMFLNEYTIINRIYYVFKVQIK